MRRRRDAHRENIVIGLHDRTHVKCTTNERTLDRPNRLTVEKYRGRVVDPFECERRDAAPAPPWAI